MKKLFAAALVLLSAQAFAQSGPYYLSSVGFCNVRQFYLMPSGFIYGKEIGCASDMNTTFSGFYSGGTKFSVSRLASGASDSTGSVITAVYDLATTNLDSYTTDGLSVTNEGLGRTYTFSTTAPSRSRTRSLPNHDLP